MESHAVYPGTFDPPTKGHFDVVRRSQRLFSKVTVAISVHPSKTPLFSFEERKNFFLEEFRESNQIEVASFERELLVDFAQNMNAQAIIRGLRAVSDFDYELQMTLMNRRLNEEIETIFLMPSEQYSFLSSSLVKEVASLGGDVSEHVSPSVREALDERFRS
ncbi:MAG: pantetheine-phosphate adenylyltransferase [Nitrospinae bacterium]|nr:pantetheine-phosphate adenylyltransferase [Nitrospinota bacterium]